MNGAPTCPDRRVACNNGAVDQHGARHLPEDGHVWLTASRTSNQGGGGVNARPTESEPLLTPAEVAAMFRVDPKTVTRWAKAGKLSSIRTLGGHRRYRESEVRELLAGVPGQRQAD